MKFQKKKSSCKYLNIICWLTFFPLLIGCEDLFLRFKYETYECTKNYFKLKSVFIKNYELGDTVDVEILQSVGMSVVVPNTNPTIDLKQFDWVTKRHGGYGAIRDVCDLIYFSKTLNEEI